MTNTFRKFLIPFQRQPVTLIMTIIMILAEWPNVTGVNIWEI